MGCSACPFPRPWQSEQGWCCFRRRQSRSGTTRRPRCSTARRRSHPKRSRQTPARTAYQPDPSLRSARAILQPCMPLTSCTKRVGVRSDCSSENRHSKHQGIEKQCCCQVHRRCAFSITNGPTGTDSPRVVAVVSTLIRFHHHVKGKFVTGAESPPCSLAEVLRGSVAVVTRGSAHASNRCCPADLQQSSRAVSAEKFVQSQ